MQWKPIRVLELTRPTAFAEMPAVLLNESGNVSDFEAMQDFCRKSGPAIRQHLSEVGCVLLRGVPVRGAQQFEDVLKGLEIPLSDNYIGGLSPRRALTQHVFTSTEAPGDFLISYHNEMCYLKDRPETIAFHCEVAPEVFGETPIFSSPAMLETLSPELRAKLKA